MNKLAKTIEYLFYLFIFLLPWQTRWIWHYFEIGGETSQYLSFSLYGTEILLWLILVLTIIYKIKVKDEEITILNFKILDFYILFFLFFIVAILTILWAQNLQVAFYYLTKFLTGFALLIFIINFKFSFKKIGWAFVFAGLGQAILGIYQFLAQKVFVCKWLGLAEQLPQTLGVSVIEVNGLRLLRAYGAFTHPNILGGFLAICLAVLIILIFLAKTKKASIFLWLFLPILLAGLFFTFSKSAFLALGAGLLFIIIFVFLSQDVEAKFNLSQIILVIFTVLAILAIIYQGPVLARIKGESRLEQKSFAERSLYFEQAKNLIKENWFKGVGLGNYTLALYNQLSDKQPVWYYQPVHNVYILTVAELGVLGFIIFILIIIEALRKIWQFKIDYQLKLLSIFQKFKITGIFDFYKRRFYWFLGYTAIFIMLLIIMAFDHYFWTLYFGIMFWWLILGLWLKQVSLMK